MSKRHFLEFEQPIAELETKIDELRYVQSESAVDISEEIDRLSKKSQQLTKEIYSSLSPWQVTQIARHAHRLRFSDRKPPQKGTQMNIMPSFPRIRRYALLVGFVGLCFVLGLLKRIFS